MGTVFEKHSPRYDGTVLAIANANHLRAVAVKGKEELQEIIGQIASDQSPVGMDAVYVHAIILDKLMQIEQRLERLEASQRAGTSPSSDSP